MHKQHSIVKPAAKADHDDSVFLKKYRPKSFADFIRPSQTSFEILADFLEKPWASAWLLHGKRGLGKSTMARLMAETASKDPEVIFALDGSALDTATVRWLTDIVTYGTMSGGIHGIIVDEADAIPKNAIPALSAVLDQRKNACWIFTTNEPKKINETLKSRLEDVLFSAKGICEPAAKWLVEVARLEGLSLSLIEAEKIVRKKKNNLREALLKLETLCRLARRRGLDHCVLDPSDEEDGE